MILITKLKKVLWGYMSTLQLMFFSDVQPEKLEAQDGDSLRAEMSYTIVSGKPDDYKEYFNIDRRTGCT